MFKRCALLFLLFFLQISCETPRDSRLTLTGSSTVAPVAAEIARRFEANFPGTRVEVQAGGSSRGIADTRSGAASIGMVSRALKPSEADLESHLVARDGLTMIVHEDNPISTLTSDQVRDIYTGKLENWKDVGGKDLRIVVVAKAEGRSTLELFLDYFSIEVAQTKPSIVIGDNLQGIKTVAGNSAAIGYVSIGAAIYEQKSGTPIRAIALEGVEPSLQAVKSGNFPIVRALNLVTKGAPNESTRKFIEFARSSKVEDIIHAHYFLPPS